MEKILLIPSATLVPEELRMDLGPVPMGLIPLNGSAILEHISSSYSGIERKYVASMEESERISNYISRRDPGWSQIDLDQSISLADTLCQSLERIEKQDGLEDKYLQINFADTLIKPLQSRKNVIYHSKVDYTSRWTSFNEDSGEIQSVSEKFSRFSNQSKNVFVGVFGLKSPKKFLRLLKAEVDSKERNETSDFFEALLNYLEDEEYELVKTEDWIDVGHLDTYHSAKKKFLNTRNFNNLEVDERKNTITKKSKDVKKLKPEIEWYKSIPADIKPYTPRIYSSSIADNGAEITMDYTGYPSLGDLLLYGSHEIHVWKSIFDNIFELMENFQNHQIRDKEKVIQKSLKEMYLHKTKRRNKILRNNAEFRPFFENDEVTINGDKMMSPGHIIDNLDDLLREKGLYNTRNFYLLHGDMTFSNILYDVKSGVVNLIDPRGEFGEFQIYGDSLYDLAKMRHSVSGGYDFVINDMFEASISGKEAEYRLYREKRHLGREKLFETFLRSRYEDNLDKIKSLESLLFMSMVPLHSDKPERQKYMIAKGCELANKHLLT